jgi:hypothetical protein
MFSLLFWLEAACRVRAHGLDSYLSDEPFDAFVAAYSLPTELAFGSVQALHTPDAICWVQLIRYVTSRHVQRNHSTQLCPFLLHASRLQCTLWCTQTNAFACGGTPLTCGVGDGGVVVVCGV